MSDLVIWAAIVVFFAASWSLMHRYYRRIWHARLKWWAIPFAHGAVLFHRRLPHSWEMP